MNELAPEVVEEDELLEDELLEEDEVEVKASEPAEKPDELLPLFQTWIDDDVSQDEIIVKLHEDYDLTFPQAVNRFRKLKKQAGLTSPKGFKSAEVQEFIQGKVDDGLDRKDIIAQMIEVFGYTPKSAASTFSIQGKKLGIIEGATGSGARVPLADVVAFMRQNVDSMDKQNFVKKMSEELGYAESTCNSFYIYIPMAKEWARQANG